MTFVHKAFAVALAACPLISQAISFNAGDYYTSTGFSIDHFSTSGALIDRLDFGRSDAESRGIAFAPTTRQLYVVHDNPFNSVGEARVDVINGSGTVARSYNFGGWIGGMVSSGNIQFAPSGTTFYVGAQDGVYTFDVNGSRGTKLIGTEANDLKVLANGDLLIAGEYGLSRYSATGQPLAEVGRDINDPLGLTKNFNDFGPVQLVDVRGIEYDQRTNTTFVTMLGYSGGYKTEMGFKILALDGFSNQLKGIGQYWYGADMALTSGGNLLVGSWTQSPGIFDFSGNSPLTLNQIGSFEGGEAVFVTSMPVPEPGQAGLLFLGLGLMAWVANKRSRT